MTIETTIGRAMDRSGGIHSDMTPISGIPTQADMNRELLERVAGLNCDMRTVKNDLAEAGKRHRHHGIIFAGLVDKYESMKDKQDECMKRLDALEAILQDRGESADFEPVTPPRVTKEPTLSDAQCTSDLLDCLSDVVLLARRYGPSNDPAIQRAERLLAAEQGL